MTQTDIPPSLIARLSQAARYVMSGVTPATWFGPMQPLQPMAPADVAGRRFDYPTGYNLTTTPRSYESITFDDLRALADNCDILRSVIETRKDQMEALEWAVRVAPSLTHASAHTVPSDDQKRRIDLITQFLHCPDKEHSFAGWLRQLLEDMFVIDAACLYKRRTRAGGLYALEVIDGATIKILLDENGRLPAPPDPAYQQILKGVPTTNYTREELMYIKHNPRSHKVYGYSHVEQVMVTVNILIRRAMHQLEYYKDGSIPDAFIGLPKEWNQDQIVAFQRHFDAMMSGNLGARRKVRFMSGDFKYQETKAPPLKDSYDEFLARIICFVFSISPDPFVGQINRATAQTSHQRAIEEGIAPLQRFVRGIINRVIKTEFASPDLEFVWQDIREQDPQEAAQIDVAYVGAGIMTVNEVRGNLGLLPITTSALTPSAADQKKTKNSAVNKFNPHHRGPGPGGGQFTTCGGASAASLHSSLAQPSKLPQGTQVATDTGTVSDANADPYIMQPIIPMLPPSAMIEEGAAALGLGEAVDGALAESEIGNVVNRAIQLSGNDGEIVSNIDTAKQAAQDFVGESARPIYDRMGNAVGKISQDGTRVVRYTSVDKADSYINLENKTTGGNLHVRWKQ